MAAFWNSRRKGIFNSNGDAVRNGVDGSSQYANRKHAHFSAIDLSTNESVSFKAFITSFSIVADHQSDEDSGDGNKEKYKKTSKFSYNIDLEVPSHSTNEARNNLAKFAILEKFISISSGQRAAQLNVGQSVVFPKIGYALSNLIQNGKFRLGDNFDESGVNHDKVILGMQPSINFSPDLESGFYEFNNKLIAKSYKLSLKIDLILNSYLGTFLNGFGSNGYFNDLEQPGGLEQASNQLPIYADTSYWPFGIMTGDVHNANGKYGDYTGKYYSLKQINTYGRTSFSDSKYATNKGLYLGISSQKFTNNRHVLFKAYLESFSYTKENGLNEVDIDNNPAGVTYSYNGMMDYKWSFTLNVPSNNVQEAIMNLAKLNIIYRLSINYVKEFTGATSTNLKAYSFIRLANYIFNPTTTYEPKYSSAADIQRTGFLCTLDKVDFEVDTEMGFYEEAGHLIPKVFKLSFDVSAATPGSVYYGSAFELAEGGEISGKLSSQDYGQWPFGMDWYNPTQSTEMVPAADPSVNNNNNPNGEASDGESPSTSPTEIVPDTNPGEGFEVRGGELKTSLPEEE